MHEEIERIALMLKQGQLSAAQAAELMEALAARAAQEQRQAARAADPIRDEGAEVGRRDQNRNEGPASSSSRKADAEQDEADDPSVTDNDEPACNSWSGGRWYGRGSRWHRHHRHGLDRAIRDTVRSAFKVGAEALRESAMGGKRGGAFAGFDFPFGAQASGATRRSRRGGRVENPGENRVVMSRVSSPSGDQFQFEHNEFIVSDVRDLRMHIGEFTDNKLKAVSIADLVLDEGIFRGHQLRGSSLREVTVTHGLMRDNQFNGASVVRLEIRNGQLVDSAVSGGNLRDCTIADSTVEALRVLGGGMRGCEVLATSRLHDVEIRGAFAEHLTVTGSELDDVDIHYCQLKNVTIEKSRLKSIVIGPGDVVRELSDSGWRKHKVRDFTVRNMRMNDVAFIDCRFSDTTFADCEVNDMTFAGVDFRGLTLNRVEDFVALARPERPAEQASA